MVHPGGRPRTTSLPPEEMIKLGEEMIKWVLENDPIHLSQWYCIEKNFTDNEWEAYQQLPEFHPYYKKALKLVGYKYLQKNSDIEPSLKQRWQRVYFKDLRQSEDLDLDQAAERAKAIQKDIPPNDEKISKENEKMTENYRLRQEIEELKKKIANN